MSTQNELMAAGMPWGQAVQIGQNPGTGLVAAGTTKAGALVLAAQANVFVTVSSGKGASLPNASGAPNIAIYNGGSNALLVYTGNSLDVINALSAGGSFSVTNGKSALFTPAANRWIANLSA